MTQSETLELIGNQLLKLSEQIAIMIEQEDYTEIQSMMQSKSDLILKYVNAKKTTSLNIDEQRKFLDLEAAIREKENSNLNTLKRLRSEGEKELGEAKNHIKINSAYTIQAEEQQGQLFDLEE